MALLVVTILALVFYACLIFYYARHWKRLPIFEPPTATTPGVFISVVIAARNEATNLPHLLNALQNQTYPAAQFEMIVVDDFSTDGTQDVLKSFLNERVICIQPGVAAAQSSKKKAVEAGVQKAKGSLIVVTDADCKPPPHWLFTMALFQQEKGSVFIAAPVKFLHDKSLLQIFQVLDFITLQGITAASVHAGFHSMCNGANLAYTKRAFNEVNGFEGIDAVASGDDMLLMHKIKKRHPAGVHYVKSKAAIVSTAPMPTWKDFFMQRRRWASKTTYYDDKAVFYVLLFIYGFNCLFFVLVTASFLNPFYVPVFIGYLVLKTIIEWPFVYAVAKFYNQEKLMRYFPFMQPLHILYTISVGFISQLGMYSWKGRRLK